MYISCAWIDSSVVCYAMVAVRACQAITKSIEIILSLLAICSLVGLKGRLIQPDRRTVT